MGRKYPDNGQDSKTNEWAEAVAARKLSRLTFMFTSEKSECMEGGYRHMIPGVLLFLGSIS